jgi:3' terminal RNA ribose 2'-O-methyltransferase Hen1
VFLTISYAPGPGEDATELGFLLHKHPDRPQSQALSVGIAHVFYLEADADRCTAALLLEVDPVGLVRDRARSVGQYVNDRPYAAGSLLAVALGRTFRTAMSGRCTARPELAERALPLRITVPALPCPGGVAVAQDFFGPLGWQVDASALPLDETVPEWGNSRYVDLTLTGRVRLADALHHLYVLLPALDGAKHYWIGPDEVDKLVRTGAGWLAGHPERVRITRRYLARREHLTRAALARLAEVDDLEPERLDDAVPADTGTGDEPVERPLPLNRLRRRAILDELRALGAHRVGDLGCGDGALTGDLLADPTFTAVVATDVSVRALQVLSRKLHLDRLPPRRRDRLALFQSSLVYRDERLSGLDAAVLMEVVEHVDPSRLDTLEMAVFAAAAPGAVLVTTPNVEHNVRYETLPTGRFRHPDHRFEWTRAEFASWATGVAERNGYRVELRGIGTDDPEVGPPTQFAIFTREEAAA